MFKEIFSFELKYRLRRPATYFYGLLLFAFTLFIFLYGGGAEKVNVDSPYYLALQLTNLSIFTTMIASAIMGVPVYRDIEHDTKGYFFTYPISEKGYLMGRYLGSFFILAIVGLMIPLGAAVGSALAPIFNLGDNADRYEGFRFAKYAMVYATILLPNFFFIGTLFFSLVALTRNIFVNYAGGVLLFIVYLVTLTLTSDLENKTLVQYLDPYGLSALQEQFKTLTPPEKNTFLGYFQNLLVWNRVIWVSASAFLLLFTLYRFDFQRFIAVKLGKKQRKANEVEAALSLKSDIKNQKLLPSVSKIFSSNFYLKSMFSLAGVEFRNIIKDVYFIVMIIAGGLFLFLDGFFASITYGVRDLPMTYHMVEAQDGTFFFFVLIIIVFYTGEVVHRDKSVRYANIADALPVPNWMLYGSKFLSLIYVVLLLGVLVIACGMLNQIFKGYFNFELPLYLEGLVVPTAKRILMVMLAFFIHILVNNKFTGHIINVGFWVVQGGIQQFAEASYNMFFYGNTPNYRLSDMNQMGHFWAAQGSFLTYWLALGGIFIVVGNLLWNRGSEDAWKARWSLAKQRFNKLSGASLVALAAIFIGSGAWTYYNVSVVNDFMTADQNRELQANYEKTYRKYLNIPQPKMTDVKIDVALYPSVRRAVLTGFFTMVNKTNKPIDSLHLSNGSPVTFTDITKLTWNGAVLNKIHNDTIHKYYIYKLPKTMMPNDTVWVEMGINAEYRGFPNEGIDRSIVYNGTFFDLSIFPQMGYSSQGELSSEKYRKKYGLEIRDHELPARTDSLGLSTLLFNDDGDFVTFEGTVSTEADQIAVLPGYLQKEWTTTEGGKTRRHFKYQQDGLMDLFFSVVSARYDVKRDTITLANGKPLIVEIFHHPKHKYNLSHFTEGVIDAVQYFSKNYTPYQYRQLRILEFPRYAGFAQSFPNTVPYSESFGWVADFKDPDKTDYAYYVTAHEVAHQWWGHQICPSFTRGANQISESMAEYSALMVLKNKYGKDVMQNFLKYALEQYQQGRGFESKAEETLLDNETGSYIWYQKGSLVLYALQDYIGEDKLNAAFKAYAEKAAMREKPPFTTTDEWYSYIKGATPDSLKYFVEDCFEKLTLYENKVKKAEYTDLGNGQTKVKLTVEVKKLYYDKKGNQTGEGKGKDLIDIGIFAADGKNAKGMKQKTPLYLQKHWLTAGEHVIELTVKGTPEKAGIDPYNKLIDRIADDNLISVEKL
jgi:ABC-2 type transport system permease protein